MARGNKILLETREYRGRHIEGKIKTGETPKPGQIVQIDPDAGTTTPLSGGSFVFEIYNADADGGRPKGPYIVLLEDNFQGKPASDAYAAGERCFGYVPLPGDELNLLVANISGTGDDHALGEIGIVDDTTGKIIVTTGSPETEVAMLLESSTDPTADALMWYIWTGY